MKKTLLMIFLLVATFSTISAESCDQTSNCTQGYCKGGVCIVPEEDTTILANCQVTSDCIEGYCKGGQCLIPKGEEKSVLIGLKSGCVGLFSCPETSLFCFIICNLLWVVLLVMSCLAGYLSKNFGNKAFPVFFFLFPLFIAFISIVAAGIIVGIMEIVLIKYKKERTPEEEGEETAHVGYLAKTKKRVV